MTMPPVVPPIVPPITPPPKPPIQPAISDKIVGRKQFWQEKVKEYIVQAQTPVEPLLTPTTEQRVAEFKARPLWQQFLMAPAFQQRAMVPAGMPTELPEQFTIRQKQVVEQSVLNTAKSQWFVDFYTAMPALVAQGIVSSYDDYIKVLGINTPEYINQQDMAEANDAISDIAVKKSEGTLPEFMQISPEQEAAVRKFIEQPKPPAGIPISVHSLTMDAIKASIMTPPVAQLPKGMTPEELLKIASLMDIPDSIKDSLDMDQLVKVLGQSAQEQQNQVNEVLSGVREWKVPETSLWEKALFAVSQPMQAMADIMKPYIENVSYPLAGAASYMVAKMISGRQDIETLYDKYRASGVNPWQSLGQGYKEWDLPWWQKLLIELPTDLPMLLIPGIGLSVPGKVLTKVGSRFSLGVPFALGRSMLALNEGLYHVLDFLPSVAKAGWTKFPKTFDQIINSELDKFMQSELYPATSKITGKAIHQLTPADISRTMEESVKAFRATPNILDDPVINFGRSLSDFTPMSKARVHVWSNSRGGDPAIEFTDVKVSEVNNVIRDSLMKVGSPQENAKRLAIALGVDDTPEVIGKLVKDIAIYSERLSTDIGMATKIGKAATVGGVSQMLDYLKTKQLNILKVTVKGETANGHMMSGIILGLQNGLDRVQNHAFRMAVDRFLVRPLAEAYLGNISYPFWNALEGMAISIIEGVVPGFPKREAFLQMTKGLIGLPSDIVAHAASEPMGMLGKRPRGGITLLPFAIREIKVPFAGKVIKVPEKLATTPEWFGRKWIDLSNDWGNALRANFIMKRMSKYLVGKLYDVEGHDLNAVLARIIGKPPKIAEERLGLTQDELQRMVWNNLTAGDLDGVKSLKTILTDGNMSKAQQLRIVRKYTMLSPSAKDMAEELIGQGTVLKDNDSIVSFTQKLANQSISDLRQYPVDVADSFRRLANDMGAREVTTPGDLMDIFQSYEVMSTTASNIPSKLMAETRRKTDELYSKRLFGKVDGLWRADRQQMLDVMDRVSSSMATIRSKISANLDKLTPDQQTAMNVVLDRTSAGDALREAYMRTDGQLLDDFWALPKGQRTEVEHTALRSYRAEQWLKYRQEAAEIGAGEMLSRKEFAKLYQKLPEPRLIPVNVTNRPLSADDVAKIMGANVDALSNGIAENIAMQDKVFFVELVGQSAEANPTLFKGVTTEKIEAVYDDILRGMKMSPDMDIMQQKMLQQLEGMKQELITLRMIKSLKPDEEKVLGQWIDDVVDRAGKEKLPIGNNLRQSALDSALKDYFKTFADYSNANLVDASMKMIYPYWTYNLYKYFMLPRLAMKHPGLMVAWGKYNNYSEQGYQHIPGTDLEANAFVGSMFGATFGLARHNMISYYSNLGWAGEVLDVTQRLGAFPGAHIMLPITLTPIFTGRAPELGEAIYPLARTGLDSLVASNIPGVSKSAQWLKDRVFHSNLHDYYTTTVISSEQVKAGGNLIGGQSGTDLWYKKLRKEKFTPEEQQLWDESYRKAAWYGVIRSQFPQIRLRTEEYLDAYKQITNIFTKQLGMSEEFQDNLWKHNLRPTDVVGGLPLDLRMALDEMWQWRVYFGRGVTMMPPDVQDLYSLIDKYYGKTKELQQTRLANESDIDNGFIHPTDEVHYSGKEWRGAHAENWADYSKDVDNLKSSPDFKDAIDALTPEGQVKLASKLGFSVPTLGPMDEVIDLYFNIKLEKSKDPYTGEEDYDYLKFWLQRESVKMALPENLRADFEAYIRRYETPMERVFREVYNGYIRGYQASSRVVFNSYDEEQKSLIKEYYADTTTSDRKSQIESVVTTGGNKLISEYTTKLTQARQALRQVSPKLDFWLNVFGYVDTQKTKVATDMLNAFEKDRSGIYRF